MSDNTKRLRFGISNKHREYFRNTLKKFDVTNKIYISHLILLDDYLHESSKLIIYENRKETEISVQIGYELYEMFIRKAKDYNIDYVQLFLNFVYKYGVREIL